MPVTVRYGFTQGVNPYIDDYANFINWTSNVSVPSDMSIAQMETVLLAMDATIFPDPVPCNGLEGFEPRKLTFTRKSGSKTTIVANSRANLVNAIAVGGRNAFNAANPANPVVCIELEGESHSNLIEELRTATVVPTPVTPILPPVAAAKSRVYYKGILTSYTADSAATFAATVPVSFKLQSTDELIPPPQFSAMITTCLGSVSVAPGCSASNNLRHRRYIVDFSTTNPELPNQTIEVPQASAASVDIKDCGTALANLAHVNCLRYKGESRNRLERVLP